MKKSSTTYSPLLELSAITKKLPRRLVNRKTTKQANELLNAAPPPTEEMINYLNCIGSQYPFCVYYKHKMNDPL